MCFILNVKAPLEEIVTEKAFKSKKKLLKTKLSEEEVKFLKSEEDIVVYKRLILGNDGKFLSPYRYLTYEKGIHYYQVGQKFSVKIFKKSDKSFNIEVNEGLHCYIDKKTTLNPYSRYYSKKKKEKIFKMIIPKGSLYLVNSFGEVVTDNLIFQ